MIPALSQNSLPVGILMNRASFPRLPGDIGNPATFPFAVRYRMVPGTTYHDVVEALQEERLLVPFIAAAQALEQEGGLRHHHQLRLFWRCSSDSSARRCGCRSIPRRCCSCP